MTERPESDIWQDVMRARLLMNRMTYQPDPSDRLATEALNSAERTGRVKALREAADWFLKDDDEGGPSYTAPDGHPYYESEFWAAGHLRALADREEQS